MSVAVKANSYFSYSVGSNVFPPGSFVGAFFDGSFGATVTDYTGCFAVVSWAIFGGGSLAPPAGWTAIQAVANPATNVFIGSWGKWQPSGDANANPWTWSGSRPYAYAQCAFTGVDSVTPVDVSSAWTYNTASATATTPSVTSSAAGGLAYGTVFDYTTSTTVNPTLAAFGGTPDTDHGQVNASVSGNTAGGYGTRGASKAVASSGGSAGGYTSAVAPTTGRFWLSQSIMLKAAGAGGSPSRRLFLPF